MLDLLLFDLDGTLANTEQLKAQSYAWAAHQLRPDLDPDTVEAAYGDYAGHSREEIATALLDQFHLEDAARARDASVEPWESYVGLRLEHYRAMLADVDLVRRHARGPAVDLVRHARDVARHVALVTTSDRRNTGAVLTALGLTDVFDTLVTADDVVRTKPDPEGYRLALTRLGVRAADALAVEDSPAGLRAAVAAGIPVLPVPSPFTHDEVEAMARDGEVPPVVAPEALLGTVRQRAVG